VCQMELEERMVKDSSITEPFTIERMRMSVLDFFEKLSRPGIQYRDIHRTPSSSLLKVSVFPKGMHLENVEYQYQPLFKVKIVRVRLKVESMVNSGYPFVYFFREGGRNGHKQETFYA
jgi:hypothetical protein